MLNYQRALFGAACIGVHFVVADKAKVEGPCIGGFL